MPLYAAFLLFFTGSIVFAVAESMPVLITGRILQGLGGGGLDVLSEIILADITSLKERPLYLGLYALPIKGHRLGFYYTGSRSSRLFGLAHSLLF